jgi:cytochrome c oxidase subunit II
MKRKDAFNGMGLLAVWFFAAGCSGERTQSMLHPVGPAADKIAWLWWIMFGILSAIFVIVMLFAAWAVLRAPHADKSSPPLGSVKFIVVGGIVLPTVVLVFLLFLTVDSTVALRIPETSLTIRVVGHKWWWEVEYPEQGIVTANEIHIPAGQPVLLRLESADVIHSFWVPQLGGKMDMLPEHERVFWIQAHRPGIYRGQCAEFCGLQHALMAFVVVALPPEEFEAWLEARRRPHPEPETPLLRRGQEVFFEAGCHNCHAIRGTEAAGRIGPDLTHISTRRTLGAATVPNNHGNLAGWTVNPQPIKPGNRMPATYLGSEDLHALVAYLESLD